MNIIEYLKINLPNPNPAILYDLGASEGLVDYIMKTTWNTNFNIVKTFSEGGGSDNLFAEGNGDIFLYASGETQIMGEIVGYKTFEDIKNACENHENYRVYVKFDSYTLDLNWGDTGDGPGFSIEADMEDYGCEAIFMCMEDPTTGEIGFIELDGYIYDEERQGIQVPVELYVEPKA